MPPTPTHAAYPDGSPGATQAAIATLHAVDRLHATLQVARALVEQGRLLDLEGLDADAARVCLAVSLLPPEQGSAMKAALIAALADCDRLLLALRTQ